MAFDAAAAAILTGIECKYMTLSLVFSILPNFYEIKTNFPQNYNCKVCSGKVSSMATT